jgi:hypothetical protein
VSTAPAWYAFLLLDLAWIIAVANTLRASVRAWMNHSGRH